MLACLVAGIKRLDSKVQGALLREVGSIGDGREARFVAPQRRLLPLCRCLSRPRPTCPLLLPCSGFLITCHTFGARPSFAQSKGPDREQLFLSRSSLPTALRLL